MTLWQPLHISDSLVIPLRKGGTKRYLRLGAENLQLQLEHVISLSDEHLLIGLDLMIYYVFIIVVALIPQHERMLIPIICLLSPAIVVLTTHLVRLLNVER